MHKFYLELLIGLLGVVGGIYATNSQAIAWLWRKFSSVSGQYTAWLCFGVASVSFGLALHNWLKVNGHDKSQRISWAVVLTLVLLLSSWSIRE